MTKINKTITGSREREKRGIGQGGRGKAAGYGGRVKCRARNMANKQYKNKWREMVSLGT